MIGDERYNHDIDLLGGSNTEMGGTLLEIQGEGPFVSRVTCAHVNNVITRTY